MYYHSIDELKQRQETLKTLAAMDGWGKAKYFGTHLGALICLIAFNLLKPLDIDTTLMGLGLLASGMVGALLSYCLIYAIQEIWEAISK